MSHERVNLKEGYIETKRDGDAQTLQMVNPYGSGLLFRVPDHDAFRLAYALSPAVGENFERARKASHALWRLSYPECSAQELRDIAEHLDEGCDEPCSQRALDRGDFCHCTAIESLRDLADALDLKAKVEVERIARWRWLRWVGYRTFMPVWPRLAIRCLRPEEIPF